MEKMHSGWPRTGRSPIFDLSGSASIFTEIPEHTDFSLIQNTLEFKYKSDQNSVPSFLIIGLILFL